MIQNTTNSDIFPCLNSNVTKTKLRCTKLKHRIRYEEEQLRDSKEKKLLTNYWRTMCSIAYIYIYIYMIESIVHGIFSKCRFTNTPKGLAIKYAILSKYILQKLYYFFHTETK